MTEAAITNADIDWDSRRATIARARQIARRVDLGRDAVTALAIDCALAVERDPAVAAFVEARLGFGGRADSALWRGLGIGVCRATLLPDGTWEPFADGDVPREIAGRGVPAITIPVVIGRDLAAGEAIEIFAVELEPGKTARATGRVYALTGLAIGLGLDNAVFGEWRDWSRGLALAADPLEWVRLHCVVALPGAKSDEAAHREFAGGSVDEKGNALPGIVDEVAAREAAGGEGLAAEDYPAPSGPATIVAPILGEIERDGLPAVWLAELDPAQRVGEPDAAEWAWRAGETDRFLLESSPIVGATEDVARLAQRRVDAARKRAFPPIPAVEFWTPVEPAPSAKGEAA